MNLSRKSIHISDEFRPLQKKRLTHTREKREMIDINLSEEEEEDLSIAE